MKLGQTLRELRIADHKTQQEICESCGFKQGNYTSWETGRYIPSAENLIKLANYFGCTTDYLLGRESEDGTIVIKSDTQYSDEEQEFIKYYRKLSARQKFAALSFVKGMLAG